MTVRDRYFGGVADPWPWSRTIGVPVAARLLSAGVAGGDVQQAAGHAAVTDVLDVTAEGHLIGL